MTSCAFLAPKVSSSGAVRAILYIQACPLQGLIGP
jgi:hypothetical protein